MKIPPQIKGSPISGHYRKFKSDPLGLLLQSSQELGDIFMLKAFNKPIYFVNHPDLIEYVTQTNYQNYIKTPATPLRLILGDGIFTTDGEEWLKRRRLYQPALNNTAIKSYFDTVNQSVKALSEEIGKSEHVNITRLMTDVTITILGQTLFSTILELDPKLHHHISVIMEWIGDRRLRHPFVLPTNWPSGKNKKFLAAVKGMDEIIYRIIDQQKSELGEENLLSRFMHYQEEGSPPLNAKELRDEVMTIFLAGHETSANVLNWTFYLLATHPDIQEKVRSEIQGINSSDFTYEDLRSMTYTLQVLNESMRLFPPVWHFGRVNVEDDVIGGYKIPSGTAVRISPFTIQRRDSFWNNPNQFDPDRFSPSNDIQPFTHIPFGAGPRLCAGRNFAIMEMLLILGTVIGDHQLSYEENQVEMAPMITLRSNGEITLKVNPI